MCRYTNTHTRPHHAYYICAPQLLFIPITVWHSNIYKMATYTKTFATTSIMPLIKIFFTPVCQSERAHYSVFMEHIPTRFRRTNPPTAILLQRNNWLSVYNHPCISTDILISLTKKKILQCHLLLVLALIICGCRQSRWSVRHYWQLL